MIIFANSSHFQEDNRYLLSDPLKPLWNDLSDEQRLEKYGYWIRFSTYSSNICKADIVFLTMKWNYYVDRSLVHLAQAEIEAAQRHGKKIVVFSGGDYPASLTHPSVILIEPGGYRSNVGLAYHTGLPFFLKDYLQLYCGCELQLRQKTPVPVVGFCGQAGASPARALFRKARSQARRLAYRAGLRQWQPAPFETTTFRRSVLRAFDRSERVRSNYLLREQYHAGSQEEKGDFSSKKLAFVRNILDSDYTVCMRGGGNFSVRFYETLALGRIPVFIDTDCLLPFEDCIPYREIFPWIEMKDLPRAAEILAEYHARLSNRDFIEKQKACRNLWQEHFTANGFYTDLHNWLNHIVHGDTENDFIHPEG